ncbi:hypothetical protein BJX68DRAFT_267326 [Aspergillus pseudodeflectus]|uniref:Xylanolytic transcriptional activator regulatory domain-containing protein n=1 Tax=Aspergillus pseudodeflectus TaxID=176178 RepID=A0ABR4K9L3_9EURO
MPEALSKANSLTSTSTKERARDATPPGTVDFSCYAFLELENLQALGKEDINYLRSKGCFSLPRQPALNEFVTEFFLHTHPATPVLDESKFWHLYLQLDGGIQNANQKLSLFVFQAMLFMACSNVSLETIQNCGFPDKDTARASFYNHAKLLFDLHAENSPLNKAQGSVLLSHHISPDDPQTGSLWLASAIQNTMMVSSAGDLQDGIKKRLWWSILLRDRCLCLGLRRRTQITLMHFNTKTSQLEEADFADEIANSHVYDEESKQILFKALQNRCRLAVLVSDMVTFMFTTNGSSSPLLKAFQSHRCEIKRIRNELLQWERRFNPPQTLSHGSSLPSSVRTFIKITHMYYFAAQSNLAHYEALIMKSHSDFGRQSYIDQLCECRAYLKDAVDGMTETMEYFSDCHNVKNIPLCTLAFVATPFVNAILDVKLARSYEQMVLRKQRVDLLANIYRRLALLYSITNHVAIGTNQILSLAYSLLEEVLLHEDQTHVAGSPDEPAAQCIANCLDNWSDVWLFYPRAYLLISISVDYSLSVGRLPHDSDIPEFLINTPDSPKVRLPWMTKTDLIHPSDSTGVDFWGPSYCAPAQSLSIIQRLTDVMPMANASADGLIEGSPKRSIQPQTLHEALWQGSAIYSVFNSQTTPVTFEEGLIDLDSLSQMPPPTTVTVFQAPPSQIIPYTPDWHSGIIPTTIMGSNVSQAGDYGQDPGQVTLAVIIANTTIGQGTVTSHIEEIVKAEILYLRDGNVMASATGVSMVYRGEHLKSRHVSATRLVKKLLAIMMNSGVSYLLGGLKPGEGMASFMNKLIDQTLETVRNLPENNVNLYTEQLSQAGKLALIVLSFLGILQGS